MHVLELIIHIFFLSLHGMSFLVLALLARQGLFQCMLDSSCNNIIQLLGLGVSIALWLVVFLGMDPSFVLELPTRSFPGQPHPLGLTQHNLALTSVMAMLLVQFTPALFRWVLIASMLILFDCFSATCSGLHM